MRILNHLTFVISRSLSATTVDAAEADFDRDSPTTPKPCVLFIGIDGLRTDALLAAESPHLQKLIAEGAFARNTDIIHAGGAAADTVSGPGWSNLLTGVWPDKHGVMNNKFSVKHYNDYPSFLKRFRAARPEAEVAAFVSWPPLLNEGLLTADENCQLLDGEKLGYDVADEQATAAACKLLKEDNPQLLFVYLGQVDETGHKHGFHPAVPEYLAAIKKVDPLVGQLMAAVAERSSKHREDWLTIVATDHGGIGTKHNGGRGIREIRYTFTILHGPSVKHSEIEQATHHVDIAPTALHHLKVLIDPAWKLDGKPIP